MSGQRAPRNKPTCFVVMGFGKKTDFESSHVFDLNASYFNLIKPAVEAAGLACLRADEIKHSGLIDDPMYDQLLNADVVVADISTSNRNAIYELGVRHALRPFTTVVIAEEGLMKSPFFDLSHIVIRTYRHLGEDIGVGEMRRFTGELTVALKEILARSPELRRDSPVYRHLERLIPPRLADGDEGKEATPSPGRGGGGALQKVKRPLFAETIEPEAASFSEMIEKVNEAQSRGTPADWKEAVRLLEKMRAMRKLKTAGKRKSNSSATPDDPYILQRLSLATYKSEHPNLKKALEKARDLLFPLEPNTSNDTETLGLWGSIHKRLWNLTKAKAYLDDAVRAYERGFYLRNDYYNGINFAFLLNLRAANSSEVAEAIADFVQARRVRREVLDICTKWLESNGKPARNAAPAVIKQYQEQKYWVLATMAEAYCGLNDEKQAAAILSEAFASKPAAWARKATEEQIAKLRSLLVDSPLEHITAN